MKQIIYAAAIFIVFFASTLCLADATESPNSVYGTKLRMSFEGGEVLVNLFDTQASRELLAMLPLTLSFEGFANAEKIAHLPQRLSSGISPSHSPKGDFTYYSPWGNLAVFYEGYGRDNGLYILGIIETGKEKLADKHHSFTATLEVVNR